MTLGVCFAFHRHNFVIFIMPIIFSSILSIFILIVSLMTYLAKYVRHYNQDFAIVNILSSQPNHNTIIMYKKWIVSEAIHHTFFWSTNQNACAISAVL